MTYYIIDTHIFIWFLDKNKRLKTRHLETLLNKENTFVFSANVAVQEKRGLEAFYIAQKLC